MKKKEKKILFEEKFLQKKLAFENSRRFQGVFEYYIDEIGKITI